MHSVCLGTYRNDSDPLMLFVGDHDADCRRLCRAHLQRTKDHVLQAENGVGPPASVAMEHVDAVIMDIMMPERDGLECTRRLRSDKATKSIPIITSSARTPKLPQRFPIARRSLLPAWYGS